MGCFSSKLPGSNSSSGKTLSQDAIPGNTPKKTLVNQYEMKNINSTDNYNQPSSPTDPNSIEARDQRAKAAETRIKQDIYRGVQQNSDRKTNMAETLASTKKAPVDSAPEIQEASMKVCYYNYNTI
ncbi:hypothetical protein BB561_004950 [Smittium simulii]|uniref:Uncharacterized protein n=1 Tax=Smittium simulii TaxID=133385 RepID=A0A2T9YD17_9FUNG|nr:hypothetical protein BB561_004950 [Smittium simulii]